MALPQEDIDSIARALYAQFRAEQIRHWQDPEQHAEEHLWLREWMLRRKKREKFWRDIKKTVIGYFIVVVIGGLLTFLGMAVYYWAERFVQAMMRVKG